MSTLILDGSNLNIDNITEVAKNYTDVEISEEAYERVKKARELIFDFADKGVPVYGLNRGVGWNKDKKVFKKYFEEYNRNLLFVHSVGVGEYLSEEEIRAILVSRLNTLLLGCTGMSVEIVDMYKEFLNHHIHPVIPKKGSVGEGDITNLSYVGLCMIGEGEVFYKGKRMPSKEALNLANLSTVSLGPKDGLGIVSSNAFSAGRAALVLREIYDLLEMSNIIYCLSLEGLNGNIHPIDESVNKIRKYKGQNKIAADMRSYLEGSYLYEVDDNRPLQDPLSYRGGCTVHGAIKDSLDYAKQQLNIQLNTSDDNPCILIDEERLIPCSNFEPTSWVLAFEMVGVALSHLSKMSCYRTMKLSDPSFTKLSRFLSPSEGEAIAFGTIQKTFTSLDTEIKHLSNPVTADFFSLAGDIEDHANNSPLVVDKLAKILENLRYILAIELLHSIQAIGLRKGIKLGHVTQRVYDAIREEIPFMTEDRLLYIDINKAYDFIKSNKILDCVKESEEVTC